MGRSGRGGVGGRGGRAGVAGEALGEWSGRRRPAPSSPSTIGRAGRRSGRAEGRAVVGVNVDRNMARRGAENQWWAVRVVENRSSGRSAGLGQEARPGRTDKESEVKDGYQSKIGSG